MKEWYSKANEYWMVNKSLIQDSEMTYESMFGGDEQVQREDINFSKQFLEKTMLNKTDLVLGSVLDCACGIGRVSK